MKKYIILKKHLKKTTITTTKDSEKNVIDIVTNRTVTRSIRRAFNPSLIYLYTSYYIPAYRMDGL